MEWKWVGRVNDSASARVDVNFIGAVEAEFSSEDYGDSQAEFIEISRLDPGLDGECR